MKKRIFALLCLLTAAFTVLAAVTVALLYYRFYQDNVRTETRSTCALLAASLGDPEGREALLSTYGGALRDGERLTLVAVDGAVLYDSSVSAEQLGSHADRTELIDAARDGTGEITRHSDTLGTDTFYTAVRLPDGTLLRLARRMDRIAELFEDTIPIILVLVLALLAASTLAARLLTRMAVRPVHAAANALDTLLSPLPETEQFPELRTYEELSPFIQKLRSLRAQLDEQLCTLRRERDTIGNITRNMREGLILLDGQSNILTINESAVRLLAAEGADFAGQSFVHLSREETLLAAVERVLGQHRGESLTLHRQQNEYLRFFLSPVSDEDGGQDGVLILIVDASSEMQAEQIRKEFAANVSHELKTPLTSISGFAEMMENGMIRGREEIQSCCARIHREAARLIALINDILRLSQIENGLPDREKEVCFVKDIVQEAVAVLEPAIREKRVALSCECENVILFGSRSMVYELVYNLLDNAVKYNREGGQVRISAAREGANAVLTVSDTGIGIPPEHIERIFERFYRVDKSRSKQTGGTGLGLSIVKHIVERLGGQIAAESREGEGTVMRCVLPVE